MRDLNKLTGKPGQIEAELCAGIGFEANFRYFEAPSGKKTLEISPLARQGRAHEVKIGCGHADNVWNGFRLHSVQPKWEIPVKIICAAVKGNPNGLEPYINLDAFEYR